VLVAGGVATSVAGAISWTSHEETQAAHTFALTGSSVAASVSSGLRRDLDFEAALASIVAAFPDLTNRQLAGWLRAMDVVHRYPGTIGFAYVEPVAADDLPMFEATMEGDPLVGEPGGTYVVDPPGDRPSYCLARFGFAPPSAPVPASFDFCAPRAPGKASAILTGIRAAVASGRPMALSPAAIRDLSSRPYAPDVFAVVAPVYRGGRVPPDAAARRSAFAGAVLGTFSRQGLPGRTLEPTGDLAVAIRAGAAGRGGLIASWGRADAPGYRLSRTIPTSPPFLVVVTAPPSQSPLVQGLVLGSIGVTLSVVVFLFLVHLARSRERALRMVAARTGQLRHQALHDAVTGLPNRVLLFDRAEQMLARARRKPLAVGALFLDLDNFKEVNDTFGHEVGDELLRAVAARLSAALRHSDTVGRLGGDEFLVLVESDTFDAGPELVAERLQEVLAEPFVIETPEPVALPVRASIGVAVGRRGQAEQLIRDADVALYQAKAAGKGRHVMFRPEMQTAVQDRLALEMDLREALDESGQLCVVYQPIFDLATMAPKGVEALVRWNHPRRGVLSPAAFLPVAEDSGLVVPLGRFVMEQACAHAATWQDHGRPFGVSLNVSPLQIGRPSFADEVRRVLARTGLDPAALTLEITETSLLRDAEQTIAALSALKALGVRLSVDDFGTGYSSLGYLRQFPIDAIKIDRSFVNRADDTAESGAIVHALVRLGKELGIETIAEGIESTTQLDRVCHEGCDSGQGYFLARPLDPADVHALVTQSRVWTITPAPEAGAAPLPCR